MRWAVFLLFSLISYTCGTWAQQNLLGAPAGVVVSTIEELGEALADDAVHIVEIQQHLRGSQSMVLDAVQQKYVVVRLHVSL